MTRDEVPALEEDPAWRRAEAMRRTDVRTRIAIAFLGFAIAARSFDLGCCLLVALSYVVDLSHSTAAFINELLRIDREIPIRTLAVGSLVAFLVWLHRAVANVQRQLRPSLPLEFTPAMSVGYFLIPLANLFLPFRAVSSLQRASDPAEVPLVPEVLDNPGAGYREPARVEIAPPPAPLPSTRIATWWAAWVIGAVLSRLGSNSVCVYVAVASALAAHVLTIHVIRVINRMQRERTRRLDVLWRSGTDWQPPWPAQAEPAPPSA